MRAHIFALQMAAATMAVFVLLALSRFTVLEGYATDNTNDYAVSVTFTPFLYVDTMSRVAAGAQTTTPVFNDAITNIDQWKLGIDMMPTCPQFAGIAAAAQCAHSPNAATCIKDVDQVAYKTECHALRTLWVVGILLFIAAQVALVWPVWNGTVQPNALFVAGWLTLAAAVAFTVYSNIFVDVIETISTIVTTDGFSDIDTARHMNMGLNGMLYFTTLVIFGAGFASQGPGSRKAGYSMPMTTPLFWQ